MKRSVEVDDDFLTARTPAVHFGAIAMPFEGWAGVRPEVVNVFAGLVVVA